MKKRIILTVTAVLLAFSFTACNKSGNKANSGGMQSEKVKKADNSLKENPASDFQYTMTDDGAGVKITKYIGKSPKIIIPSTIEGLPVLEVEYLTERDHEYGESSWDSLSSKWARSKNNITITHIVFPDSVRILGKYSTLLEDYENLDFHNFDALEYVKLPEGLLEPKDTGNYSYEPKKDKISKEILSTNRMPWLTNCDKLKTVVIPEGLKTIPDLSGCTSLESITLPSSVRQMGDFSECTNLKEIIIPENVSSIIFNYTVKSKQWGDTIDNM